MKKKILLLLLLLCIFTFWCWKKDIRQWFYYPTVLEEGRELAWPIFDNYEWCKNWAIDNFKKWYEAYCTKNCKDSVDWTPICEDVIRTRRPISTSKVFEWIDEIIAERTEKNQINIAMFVLDTSELYCQYKNLIEEFITWPDQQRYKELMVNWNDIPSQRALWKRLLNNMNIIWIDTMIDQYEEKYWESSYFLWTIRYMKLLHEYLTELFTSDSNLQSFEQFQNIIVTDFDASISTLQSIPTTLDSEFQWFKYDNEIFTLATEKDMEWAEKFIDIDTTCSAINETLNQ